MGGPRPFLRGRGAGHATRSRGLCASAVRGQTWRRCAGGVVGRSCYCLSRAGGRVSVAGRALQELARLSPRQCRVVELRYFGGLSVTDTADVLRVSSDTVTRDWNQAKACFYHELNAVQTMTPERYEKIGELYHAALERDPADREAFLAEMCSDDEMRREVASLIASYEEAATFIEHPPDNVAAGWEAAATSPGDRRFAHYQMLSLLGKGGMGEVWLAEDTKLGRNVAVKLLPAGFTADVARVRRFSQEARTASSLNHPNIITIYEI